MFDKDPTTGRMMSAFPLSVGTSLAFESIFQSNEPSIDPDRIIPQRISLANYTEFWINLSTLFRNLIGSLSKEQTNAVNSYQLKSALIEEMEVISSLIKNEGMNQVKLIFYVCEYKKLYSKESKFIVMRRNSTDNQKIYQALQDQSIELLLKELKQSDTLRVFDTEVNKEGYGNKKNALIITHAAYDLVSYNNFSKLDLLESHSGVLKHRSMFYTKYTDGKDLSMIPFMKGMFPVFGDSTHFRAMDIRLRREIIELAKVNNWTQLTTIAKVKSNIENLKNKLYIDILKGVL